MSTDPPSAAYLTRFVVAEFDKSKPVAFATEDTMYGILMLKDPLKATSFPNMRKALMWVDQNVKELGHCVVIKIKDAINATS